MLARRAGALIREVRTADSAIILLPRTRPYPADRHNCRSGPQGRDGYLVILDGGLNSPGWALDLLANHTLIARVVLTAWGNSFDAGYFWHYNQLWIGGAGAPGEKAWEVALMLTVFPMRIAAAIGFLQMKRWGHQWLIITCWFGVVIWIGYTFNMTMYADVRYAGVVLPVIGWWLYDIFYITPYLAIPYLHTVNREIFSD